MADEQDDDTFLKEPIKWTGPTQLEMWQLKEDLALGPIGPLSGKEKHEKLAGIRAQKERAEELVYLQRVRKLHLLLEHHKLDNNPAGPFLLCLLLCSELYPGFKVQMEEKRGRKKKWDPSTYFELFSAIDWIRKEKK